jgi:Ribbon-helix-helix protein, copG family
MKRTLNRTSVKTIPSAEQIAEMADAGESVTRFFSGNGRMMQPVQRVNVDFTASMLDELDREAKKLNISRQAVIKTLLRKALDEQYVAAAARPVARERERSGMR